MGMHSYPYIGTYIKLKPFSAVDEYEETNKDTILNMLKDIKDEKNPSTF